MVHMEDKRGESEEAWKATCCIDCVCVVNGMLFGSMVQVIKQRLKQDVTYIWPSAPHRPAVVVVEWRHKKRCTQG